MRLRGSIGLKRRNTIWLLLFVCWYCGVFLFSSLCFCTFLLFVFVCFVYVVVYYVWSMQNSFSVIAQVLLPQCNCRHTQINHYSNFIDFAHSKMKCWNPLCSIHHNYRAGVKDRINRNDRNQKRQKWQKSEECQFKLIYKTRSYDRDLWIGESISKLKWNFKLVHVRVVWKEH